MFVEIGLNLFLRSAVLLLAASGFVACSDNVSGSGLEFGDKSITVKRGGDFQAALDRSTPGDTILLESGATFSGSFRLPKKAGSQFITIRPTANDADLPAAGERIDPKKYASVLPKLISNVKGEPAILAVDGAHHFRFIAIEFGPTIEGYFDIIKLGTGQERTVDDLPNHIEFDRVWIHGHPTEGQRRGIAANGRHIRITNSYISDIKRKGDESQGVAVWATDGPVEIVNNYIEAAAENILFGGAGSFLKLVPTDCVVDSNHLTKPLEWKGTEWVVKNIFEIKNGRRIKVTNNLMTNNWAMGQDGNAILFTTRADNGNATVIEDIEFTGNIVRGSGGGLNILGNEGSGGHRLVIRNNIFEDINGQKWGGSGHFMKVTDWNGLTFESNTILQRGNISIAYGAPVRGFVFRNNIVCENDYGFFGDGLGSGQRAIDKFFPGGTVSGNLIVGGSKDNYRESNFFASSITQIGFRDPANGDFRLSTSSRFVRSGPGGTPLGANLDRASIGRK